MSDTELSEVDKLRAAAAKAREEYERLSKVRNRHVLIRIDLQIIIRKTI